MVPNMIFKTNTDNGFARLKQAARFDAECRAALPPHRRAAEAVAESELRLSG